MGSMSVSSCRCCMFVSCMHPVAVLNAAFCMTCSLLMLVEDARGDHMQEAYSRAGFMTASFCILHPVAVSDFIITITLVVGFAFYYCLLDYVVVSVIAVDCSL